MSNIPPHGPPPPPYYGSSPYPPAPPGPAYGYVPAPVMPVMPMPLYPHPQPEQHPPPSSTYVTNYIYQNAPDPVHVVETDLVDWMPSSSTTARNLGGRAVVAGHEGWDQSPLWVIRARYGGDCVPGKLAAKHNTAFIPFAGKEIRVYDFEVLVAPPHAVRWIPSYNGQVPVGAIAGGNTEGGEPLYIGRARHLQSLTPGKVHPSHACCYISYGGNEISYRSYEVLCKIVN